MCRRSRPQYRSDLGWILGVAFLGTLTRSARPAQGFTLVRCCGSPYGFFPTRPRGARARASHDGDPCMQLPSARGCYQLAPQRTLTSNPVPMPGTPRTLRAADAVARRRAILDCRYARRHGLRAGRDGRMAPIEQKDGTREPVGRWSSSCARNAARRGLERLPTSRSRTL